MNYSPSFKHEKQVFSYRFFGTKSKSTPRFSIEGLHLFAFTPTPLKISKRQNLEGATPFQRAFLIECKDKTLLKAFHESKPLQNLVKAIFEENIREIDFREEAVTVAFENPVRGRIRGQANRICTENPVDNEWVAALKIRLLKLSQVISRTTAMAKNMKKGHAESKPGVVFTVFFAAASAFVLTAFFVNKFWFQ